MFSRRNLLRFLPAFLIPAAWAESPVEKVKISIGLNAPSEITHEQLRALAHSLPLPELKILIENLDKIQTPLRSRRDREPLHKFQYQFPSGIIEKEV